MRFWKNIEPKDEDLRITSSFLLIPRRMKFDKYITEWIWWERIYTLERFNAYAYSTPWKNVNNFLLPKEYNLERLNEMIKSVDSQDCVLAKKIIKDNSFTLAF